MPETIAYARVSTDGQTLDSQIEALKAAGATQVFAEKLSGAQTDRPLKFGRPFRLTKHQRQQAIKLLDAGEPQAEIARHFAVDQSTISRLWARHTESLDSTAA